ncbi:MAG: serine/threonine-protein kinase [Candidatus Obscuribacterales bacterium]
MTSSFEHGLPYRDPHKDGPFVLRGRWQVVDYLGQGGMGTVYLARDLNLDNRKCVVKRLRDDFFRDEDKEKAQQFFLREAKVLSKLQHPNIVLVLDSFREDEEYYLVMEYVEGHNLHDMLKEREEPFSEDQVLTWSKQICDVLHYLHSHDPPVIYRDLKPSNVMIDTKDNVKLVDFGIARLYQDDGDNTHVVSQGYSPPEQYWGGADPRSDIYALGATMYFLLTGQEPLALTVCSPRDVDEEISEAADLIVSRATQQDVYLRYQSALEMKDELDYITSPQVEEKNGFKWLEVTVGVLVMCISIGGWFAYTKYLELKKESEYQLGQNREERVILEKRLEEVKRREATLNKMVEDKINRASASGGSGLSQTSDKKAFASPFPESAPKSNDPFATFGSGIANFRFPGLGSKPAANQSFGSYANRGNGQNLGGQPTGNQFGASHGGAYNPSTNQTVLRYDPYKQTPVSNVASASSSHNNLGADTPMEDRDESQLTDPEGLAPLEEDTQR